MPATDCIGGDCNTREAKKHATLWKEPAQQCPLCESCSESPDRASSIAAAQRAAVGFVATRVAALEEAALRDPLREHVVASTTAALEKAAEAVARKEAAPDEATPRTGQQQHAWSSAAPPLPSGALPTSVKQPYSVSAILAGRAHKLRRGSDRGDSI